MSEEDKLRANAALTIAELGPVSELRDFGLNRESVLWVDGFVERQRTRPDVDEQVKKGLVNMVGAYLGECVVVCYGGRWAKTEHGWAIQFDPKNAAYPFSKVQKQLDSGRESGESISGFFDAIPVIFRAQLDRANRPWWKLW